MGREVRRVPANWNPPRREDRPDSYQPHFDQSFEDAVREWKEGLSAWNPKEHDGDEYWEYYGDPPDRRFYRPHWEESERTHLMLYSTTTEGTPMSPPCATPEELARWCADNGASTFGYQTATYEEWLPFCRAGWAPSMVFTPSTGLVSGVEMASLD